MVRPSLLNGNVIDKLDCKVNTPFKSGYRAENEHESQNKVTYFQSVIGRGSTGRWK
jgi:hypothetical protein